MAPVVQPARRAISATPALSNPRSLKTSIAESSSCWVVMSTAGLDPDALDAGDLEADDVGTDD